MPRYTVRVELHGVKHEDAIYDTLHEVMESHGFERVVGAEGARRYLPRAEYIGDYDGTGKELVVEVQSWAKTEAKHKGDVGVLATQGFASWVGLKPAP